MRRDIVWIAHGLALSVLAFALAWGYIVEGYYAKLPCSLCMLQRAAMLGVGIGLLGNLRYGIHLQYYAFALLFSVFGLFCSGKHIVLNACSVKVLGPLSFLSYRLYTWAFLIFFSMICGISLLLFLLRQHEEKEPLKWLWRVFGAIWSIFLVLGALSAYRKLGFCL